MHYTRNSFFFIFQQYNIFVLNHNGSAKTIIESLFFFFFLNMEYEWGRSYIAVYCPHVFNVCIFLELLHAFPHQYFESYGENCFVIY